MHRRNVHLYGFLTVGEGLVERRTYEGAICRHIRQPGDVHSVMKSKQKSLFATSPAVVHHPATYIKLQRVPRNALDLRRPLYCGAVLVLAAGVILCVPISAGIPH